MNKIREFINTSKDIKFIAILILVFAFLLPFFYAHQGNILVDCGREAYWPQKVLEGKVLYKDLFNLYGPLSYQLNAVIYKLFGASLFTLYNAGLINSAIIILSLYLIFKEMTTRAASFIIALGTMILCVYNYFIFNLVFPYSYAYIYAFSSFLLSLLFLIKYLKTNEEKFIPLAFFCIGFSVASKYEFLAYFVILFLITFFLKPISNKNKLISLFAVALMPVISFGTLFLQGLTLQDFSLYLSYMKKLLASPALIALYSGMSVRSFYLQSDLINFIQSCLSFSLVGGIFYYIQQKKNKLLSGFLLLIAFGIMIFASPYLTNDGIMSWLSISTAIILTGLIIYHIFCCIKAKASFRKYVAEIRLDEKIYFLLLIITLASSVKTFFFLGLMFYGVLIFPLNFAVNLIFLINYVPQFFIKIDKEKWQRACLAYLFIFLSLWAMKKAMHVNEKLSAPVHFQKNLLLGNEGLSSVFQEVTDYIIQKSSADDKILVMPEGIMLNFLAQRDSLDYYYSYLPIDIDTFGEDKIINDIAVQKPEYIVINSRDSSDYGKAFFCKDYGHEICVYVRKNYQFQQIFGQDFVMVVYKRKG